MAAIKEWFGLYNIIYTWIKENYGYDELVEYWKNIATKVYPKLAEDFRTKGFTFIKDYFEQIFAADDGKAVGAVEKDGVTITVIESPDVKWTQSFGYSSFQLQPFYFDHYKYVYGQVADMAGLDFEMIEQQPDGQCVFRFSTRKREAS